MSSTQLYLLLRSWLGNLAKNATWHSTVICTVTQEGRTYSCMATTWRIDHMSHESFLTLCLNSVISSPSNRVAFRWIVWRMAQLVLPCSKNWTYRTYSHWKHHFVAQIVASTKIGIFRQIIWWKLVQNWWNRCLFTARSRSIKTLRKFDPKKMIKRKINKRNRNNQLIKRRLPTEIWMLKHSKRSYTEIRSS